MSIIHFLISQSHICASCLLGSPPARSFSPTRRFRMATMRALLMPPPILSSCCSVCPSVRRNGRIDIRHAHRSDLIHKSLVLALFRVMLDFYWWYHILSGFIVAAHLIFLRLALAAARI